MEDKLILFSSSKDNKIGKNKNEFINNDDEYLELNKIKNLNIMVIVIELLNMLFKVLKLV